MKKSIPFILVVTGLLLVSTPAHAAENSENLPLFDSFVNKLFRLFTPESQASKSAEQDLSENKIKLLSLFNKNEHLVRTKLSDKDLYLKKEETLAKLLATKELVEKSSMSEKSKEEMSQELDKMIHLFNMDLAESSNIKVKDELLASFDYFESKVFTLSENDTKEVLALLETSDLKF